MATTNAMHILTNVEALYPRINTTYKYDTKANNGKGQSVPCDPLDEGAKYELNFRLQKEQAANLYKDMSDAYNQRKAANWPEMPSAKEVFEQVDGGFVVKSSLKGSYNNELTKKPRQFDARNQLLPEDFELTTGSTINSHLALVPYSSNNGNGVSLRLRAVQVVKFKERELASPFGEVEGFDSTANVESFGDDFDEVPAPAPKPTPAPVAEVVEAAPKKAKPAKVDDYDSIDAALDNLDFDD